MMGDLFSFGFGGLSYGFTLNPAQMQAVPQAQLDRLMASNLCQMSQALVDLNYGMLARNAFAPPELPLDERFADFKIRLFAAIERRKLGH